MNEKSKKRFKLTSAVYLVLRKNDEVLLLKRANTGYADGYFSLVAGHLDGDELGTNAMAREAKEEAGITILPEDMKFVHVSHRLNRTEPEGGERVDIFYESRKWSGKIVNAEPHNCEELSWHPMKDLPEKTLPFVATVLALIDKKVSYSEFEEDPK